MGLRFFRRIHIAPGVTLNLGNSGVSTSLGTRGAHLTLHGLAQREMKRASQSQALDLLVAGTGFEPVTFGL